MCTGLYKQAPAHHRTSVHFPDPPALHRIRLTTSKALGLGPADASSLVGPVPGSFTWHAFAPTGSFRCPIMSCVQLCFHILLLWHIFMSLFLIGLGTV